MRREVKMHVRQMKLSSRRHAATVTQQPQQPPPPQQQQQIRRREVTMDVRQRKLGALLYMQAMSVSR
jgi:hypothetical protein